MKSAKVIEEMAKAAGLDEQLTRLVIKWRNYLSTLRVEYGVVSDEYCESCASFILKIHDRVDATFITDIFDGTPQQAV